jgi:HAD superfamily hydrolase (TIGR01490 family)
VKEVKESGGRIAAFFDLDGTLAAGPSLEQRFFRLLRDQRVIPMMNYFFWLSEALHLAPRGIRAMRYANKMYLRRVPPDAVERQADGISFFAEAVERLAWHAKEGHEIVIVSGTLETLAREAARQLQEELEARGIAAILHVRATRLGEKTGRWTGQILGEAMIGEAKSHAVKLLAAETGINLARSYAYGDSAMDRWLLAAVGQPVAVNPSKELLRLAQRRNWAVMVWEKRGEEESRQSSQRARRSKRRSGKREVA